MLPGAHFPRIETYNAPIIIICNCLGYFSGGARMKATGKISKYPEVHLVCSRRGAAEAGLQAMYCSSAAYLYGSSAPATRAR